jgi:hypothetical protein
VKKFPSKHSMQMLRRYIRNESKIFETEGIVCPWVASHCYCVPPGGNPSSLRVEQLHLFEAHAFGQSARFVVERKDATIHVALASCRACYRSHDRHYAKKGAMICSECDGPMSFESKGLKTIGNNCTLVEIAHTETSGNLVVSVRDVLAQAERSIRR